MSNKKMEDLKIEASEIIKKTLFVDYYKGCKVFNDEEIKNLIKNGTKPLPIVFRINPLREGGNELLNEFIEDIEAIKSKIEIKGVERIKWYPGIAIRIDQEKEKIRKSKEFEKIFEKIKSETLLGYISRQEEVSMIPPVALNIEKGNYILDLCAAPGSKTCQIVEMIHLKNNNDYSNLNGVVIANDIDSKRCHKLIYQLKRLKSPSFIVTNHDARQFPDIYIDGKKLKYDRILADVPCSGDGLIRKTPEILKNWNFKGGYSLHSLQSKILERGIQLLSRNGRLVYSTCSMNPIENEAVVSEALIKNPGIELIDPKELFPELNYSPGIKTWKVTLDGKNFYNNMKEVPKNLNNYKESFFPPKNEEISNQLKKCMRVYPHHGDTGGFFIAIFEWKDKTQKEINNLIYKFQKEKINEKSSFMDVNIRNEELSSIFLDYGIKNQQIRNLIGLESWKKNLKNSKFSFFTEESLKILKDGINLKVLSAGITAFKKSKELNSEKKHHFRLTFDSANYLSNFFTKRIINFNCDDIKFLKQLMKSNNFPIENLPVQLSNLISNCEKGCSIIKLTIKNIFPIFLPIWISYKNITVLVPKEIGDAIVNKIKNSYFSNY